MKIQSVRFLGFLWRYILVSIWRLWFFSIVVINWWLSRDLLLRKVFFEHQFSLILIIEDQIHIFVFLKSELSFVEWIFLKIFILILLFAIIQNFFFGKHRWLLIYSWFFPLWLNWGLTRIGINKINFFIRYFIINIFLFLSKVIFLMRLRLLLIYLEINLIEVSMFLLVIIIFLNLIVLVIESVWSFFYLIWRIWVFIAICIRNKLLIKLVLVIRIRHFNNYNDINFKS